MVALSCRDRAPLRTFTNLISTLAHCSPETQRNRFMDLVPVRAWWARVRRWHAWGIACWWWYPGCEARHWHSSGVSWIACGRSGTVWAWSRVSWRGHAIWAWGGAARVTRSRATDVTAICNACTHKMVIEWGFFLHTRVAAALWTERIRCNARYWNETKVSHTHARNKTQHSNQSSALGC